MASFKLQLKTPATFNDQPAAVQRLFDGWKHAVAGRMKSHLMNLGDESKDADIVIEVEKFEMETERFLNRPLCERTLAVRVTGQFAGEALDFHVERTQSLDLREIPSKGSLVVDSTTLIGNPALLTVIRRIAKEPNGNLNMSAEQIENEPLFAEFNLNLIEQFDKHTGRDQDHTVVLWKKLQWLPRIGALLVLIAVTTFAYQDLQRQQAKTNQQTPFFNQLFAASIGGVLAAAPAWLMLFSITASFMPLEFFQRHATGQRVMKFVGSQDPAKARLVLRLAPWILAAIGAFLWYQFISMSKR